MSTAAVVKESLKEVLVGTEEEPQLSQQTRLDFMRHAVKDEGSDDYYMNEEQFISAVAPETEDYVCDLSIIFFLSTTSPSASATAQSTFSSLSLLCVSHAQFTVCTIPSLPCLSMYPHNCQSTYPCPPWLSSCPAVFPPLSLVFTNTTLLTHHPYIAQDQALSICPPLPCRRSQSHRPYLHV